MTSDSHRMTKQQRLARFTLRGQGRFRDDEEGQMAKPATMVRRQDDWIYIEQREEADDSLMLTVDEAKYLQRQLETVLGVPFEGALAKQKRNTAGVTGAKR